MKWEDVDRLKEKADALWTSIKDTYHTLSYVYVYETVDQHPYVVSSLFFGSLMLGYFGFRRFHTVSDIPNRLFRHQRKIYGRVILANDSDGLRIEHIPPLTRWLKLETFIDRSLPLSARTLNIRLAGIDCPEGAFFGNPGQPFHHEAKKYLSTLTRNKIVSVRLLRLDQYNRAVCAVTVKRWGFWKTDVSLAMLKAGFATLYTGKDAAYGRLEKTYILAEETAKRKQVGMWKQLTGGAYESPAEYKRRMKSAPAIVT